jgi:hypothetical protein
MFALKISQSKVPAQSKVSVLHQFMFFSIRPAGEKVGSQTSSLLRCELNTSGSDRSVIAGRIGGGGGGGNVLTIRNI